MGKGQITSGIVPFRRQLPKLPEKQSQKAFSIETVEKIEQDAIAALAYVESIETADTWRRQARAIEMLLRSPELQRPMLGAQRHIEARIGQLLGPVVERERTDLTVGHDRQSPNALIDKDARQEYRLLARALAGECDLTGDGWRRSRQPLVALVRFRAVVALGEPVAGRGQRQGGEGRCRCPARMAWPSVRQRRAAPRYSFPE